MYIGLGVGHALDLQEQRHRSGRGNLGSDDLRLF